MRPGRGPREARPRDAWHDESVHYPTDLTPLDAELRTETAGLGDPAQHIHLRHTICVLSGDITAGEDLARPSPPTGLAQDDDRFQYFRDPCGQMRTLGYPGQGQP